MLGARQGDNEGNISGGGASPEGPRDKHTKESGLGTRAGDKVKQRPGGGGSHGMRGKGGTSRDMYVMSVTRAVFHLDTSPLNFDASPNMLLYAGRQTYAGDAAVQNRSGGPRDGPARQKKKHLDFLGLRLGILKAKRR